MLRDLLLSGVLGAGCAGVGTYVLHRTLWKSSNAQAKRIEALASDPSEVAVIPTSSAFSARRDPPPETFERYVKSRSGQAWNAMIDSLHMRLLKMPDTIRQVARDTSEVVQSTSKHSQATTPAESDENAEKN